MNIGRYNLSKCGRHSRISSQDGSIIDFSGIVFGYSRFSLCNLFFDMMSGDVVLLQQGAEIRPQHADPLGRLGNIAPAFLQSFDEKCLLDVSENIFQEVLLAGV